MYVTIIVFFENYFYDESSSLLLDLAKKSSGITGLNETYKT